MPIKILERWLHLRYKEWVNEKLSFIVSQSQFFLLQDEALRGLILGRKASFVSSVMLANRRWGWKRSGIKICDHLVFISPSKKLTLNNFCKSKVYNLDGFWCDHWVASEIGKLGGITSTEKVFPQYVFFGEHVSQTLANTLKYNQAAHIEIELLHHNEFWHVGSGWIGLQMFSGMLSMQRVDHQNGSRDELVSGLSERKKKGELNIFM